MATNNMWESIRELSFRQVKEYQLFCDDHHDEITQLWLLQRMMGNKPGKLHLPGICDACNEVTIFEAQSKETDVDPRFSYEVNWWSGSICGKCSLPCIDRSVLNCIAKLGLQAKHIYHVGHYSRLAAFLRSNYRYITTSQYSADKESGAREGDLIFEDLTRLSFANDTFDAVVCMEILEHIPDYLSASTEIFRVLKSDGTALMTFPWLGGQLYEHETRAIVEEDGSITHLLAPQYHGDPAAPGEGILSFRSFGWKILDELRDIGFTDVRAEFIINPLNGYWAFFSPIILATK